MIPTIKFSSFFPPKGYIAITLVFWIIVRKDLAKHFSQDVYRHELIHAKQQTELWIIPFFIIYGLHYLYNLCKYRNHRLAYRNICFERESFKEEKVINYLNVRERFAWVQYLTL